MYKAVHSFEHDGERHKRGATVKGTEKTLEALYNAGLIRPEGVDVDKVTPEKTSTKADKKKADAEAKRQAELPPLPAPPPVA